MTIIVTITSNTSDEQYFSPFPIYTHIFSSQFNILCFLSSRLIINTPSCSNLFPSYYFLQSFLLITSSFTTPPFSLNRLLLLLLSVINSVINVYHFIYLNLLLLSLMFFTLFIDTSYFCHSYLHFFFNQKMGGTYTIREVVLILRDIDPRGTQTVDLGSFIQWWCSSSPMSIKLS